MITWSWVACAWVGRDELAGRQDRDGDGYGAEAFGGDDCDDRAPRVHPGAADVPGDGVDADCDGADATTPTPTHSADPTTATGTGAATGETAGTGDTGAPGESACADGVDDDGDGDLDCADADCAEAAECLPDLRINEVLADPPDAVLLPLPEERGDANCDGRTAAAEDEFVELVNTGPVPIPLDGGTIEDTVSLRHTFRPGALAPGEVLVVFGGGTWGRPGGGLARSGDWCVPLAADVRVEIATSGALGLDGAGDTLTVRLDGRTYAVSWGAEGDRDASLNRDPDLDPGPLVRHVAVPGHDGAFSPGRGVDGAPLVVPAR